MQLLKLKNGVPGAGGKMFLVSGHVAGEPLRATMVVAGKDEDDAMSRLATWWLSTRALSPGMSHTG